MKISAIKQLIDLVVTHNINELEVKSDQDYIRILSGKSKESQHQCIKNTNTLGVHSRDDPDDFKQKKRDTSTSTKSSNQSDSDIYIRSPVAGTIYLSPSPQQENFVYAGQKISCSDTLCLIESMKTFTKVASHSEGLIKKCLVKNGQNVEAKQIIFVLNTL